MANDLTKPQLDELHRKLDAERTRLVGALRTPAAAAPQSEHATEFEEEAQRAAELDRALLMEARDRALLAEVERALTKLREGRYGVSEKSGAPIPYERLLAVPWARENVDE
jgi:DnaK suppressor protein